MRHTTEHKPKTIACSCGKNFRAIYDFKTGILKSKKCPNCVLRAKLVTKSNGHDKTYAQKPDRLKSARKTGKNPKQRAMANADKWFSRYIRINYGFPVGNGEWMCKCIVTGRMGLAKNFDCGHYISRKYKTIRFEEDNCRPQNRSSNRFSGEADHYKFRENLIKDIGIEKVERIERLKDEEGEDNEIFYREIADKYRMLTNELIKKCNIKKWW